MCGARRSASSDVSGQTLRHVLLGTTEKRWRRDVRLFTQTLSQHQHRRAQKLVTGVFHSGHLILRFGSNPLSTSSSPRNTFTRPPGLCWRWRRLRSSSGGKRVLQAVQSAGAAAAGAQLRVPDPQPALRQQPKPGTVFGKTENTGRSLATSLLSLLTSLCQCTSYQSWSSSCVTAWSV